MAHQKPRAPRKIKRPLKSFRILYVDAILAKASSDCLFYGLKRALLRSKKLKSRTFVLKRVCIHPQKGQSPLKFFSKLAFENWDTVILSGSEKSVTHSVKDKWVKDYLRGLKIFLKHWKLKERPFPLLGICFGHQAISRVLGAKVKFSGFLKVGPVVIDRSKPDFGDSVFQFPKTLFPQEYIAYHSDHVTTQPKELKSLFRSPYCKYQGFAHPRLPLLTCQFHPEMDERILNDSSDKETWKNFSKKSFQKQKGASFLKCFIENCLEITQ